MTETETFWLHPSRRRVAPPQGEDQSELGAIVILMVRALRQERVSNHEPLGYPRSSPPVAFATAATIFSATASIS